MKTLSIALALLINISPVYSQENVPASSPYRTQDVIYLKKDGFALTYDIVTPKKQNGAAVAIMMSGGWFSNHSSLKADKNSVIPSRYKKISQILLSEGYTLFYIVHGSQPRFTIPEIVSQTTQAINHIRKNAEEYGIDTNRIGVQGGSAGGHLSLMQGLQGKHQVQAVVAYFPPTDFLNYGIEGQKFDTQVRKVLKGKNPFNPALELRELDKKEIRIKVITDEEKVNTHIRKISPIHLVDKEDAPIFLIHGNKDELVPMQQSEILLKKLKEAGVPNNFYMKEGGGHGWSVSDEESQMILEWFDLHLK